MFYVIQHVTADDSLLNNVLIVKCVFFVFWGKY